MIILGINTATANTEISLIEAENIIFEKNWPSNRDEAEKLFPILQNFLTKKPNKIFVVHGPGPFTALRVGVTMANTLAFIYKIPVISCTTFEYFLRKLPSKYEKNTAIILKAGSGFFNILLPLTKETTSVDLNQLPNFFKDRSIRFLTGDVSEEDKKQISEILGIGWGQEKDMKTLGELLLDINNNPLPEYPMAEPMYLQPPKITQSKKKIFL